MKPAIPNSSFFEPSGQAILHTPNLKSNSPSYKYKNLRVETPHHTFESLKNQIDYQFCLQPLHQSYPFVW